MNTSLLQGGEEDDLRSAAQLLREGEVIGVPTETVYGLAARADDSGAVDRIYELKGRPREKKLTRLIPDPSAWRGHVSDLPATAAALADRFWPGPLTLVVPGKGGGTVGLRCPDMDVTRRVLRLAEVAVVAPSANLSGEPPAVTASEVLDVFEGRIPAVVDGGRARMEVSSTVVQVDADGSLAILRRGAVSEDEVRAAAG